MSTPEGAVFVDGNRCAPGAATVSVYDRGFLYGDSVFEVIRTYGGRPFGLEEHVARLHRSAEKVEMQLPWSEQSLTRELLAHVREAGFPESYIRVIVTRGVGELGLDPDLAGTPTRVTMIHPLTLPPVAVYRDGVAMFVCENLRATDHTRAEGAKSSNYLANLLALREAKRHGAYEPLFVERHVGSEGASGERLEVLEGGTSNVFVVEGKTLRTPPERRILGGITRKHVIAAAPVAGYEVRAEPITLGQLLSADEVFLTSTVREIVPVVRIVGAQSGTIGSGVAGPATRAVHRAFRAHVGAATDPMPWER